MQPRAQSACSCTFVTPPPPRSEMKARLLPAGFRGSVCTHRDAGGSSSPKPRSSIKATFHQHGGARRVDGSHGVIGHGDGGTDGPHGHGLGHGQEDGGTRIRCRHGGDGGSPQRDEAGTVELHRVTRQGVIPGFMAPHTRLLPQPRGGLSPPALPPPTLSSSAYFPPPFLPNVVFFTPPPHPVLHLCATSAPKNKNKVLRLQFYGEIKGSKKSERQRGNAFISVPGAAVCLWVLVSFLIF